MNKELNKYSNLAQTILNQETRYQANKNIIQDIFKTSSVLSKDTILFRLTIIDSYYSTQMSKRLYGLEDLAEALNNFKNDDELRSEANKFLVNPKEGKIKALFEATYGFDKQAKNRKKAISLLSKYLYFLLNYKFPIYDNLGLASYKLLAKNKFFKKKTIKESNYFELMITLNKDSGINNFERLDNFLWLLGKIKEGSFSIIMNKEKYETLVTSIQFSSNLESKKIDNEIRDYIEQNYMNLDFTKDEKDFFKFAFALINYGRTT